MDPVMIGNIPGFAINFADVIAIPHRFSYFGQHELRPIRMLRHQSNRLFRKPVSRLVLRKRQFSVIPKTRVGIPTGEMHRYRFAVTKLAHVLGMDKPISSDLSWHSA
jgi:hypothetical protein